MRGIFPTVRNPWLPFPVDQVWRRWIVFSFPPDIPVRCAGHIGEDSIPGDRFHCIGIRFFVRSRSHAKITIFWIDRMEPTIRTWFHPGDVIPDGSDLPPFVRIRWNHHGKVRLPTSRRKSRRHISFLTRRILNTQNKHMFGQPTLVPPQIRGDPQCQTLLTKERVPPISRAHGNDLVLLWKVGDVTTLWITV